MWSIKIQSTEEFDEKHLNICNIDNNSNQQNKIIVGGFDGKL